MTPRQHECLTKIRELTVDGVPPSYSELSVAMGVTSKAAVHGLIMSLRDRGLVTVDPHKARSVRVTHHGELPLEHIAQVAFHLHAQALRERRVLTREDFRRAVSGALRPAQQEAA